MPKYIDADALVAKFHKMGLGENSLIEKLFADGVYAVIDTFPTADVYPVVHGRWILCDTRLLPFYKCSECKNISFYYAFCPHCGAKMDGKDE